MAAEAPVAEIGIPAPDFELPGTDGAKHRLRELAGERGTVVAFICNHCPYVKAILPRLVRDARDLAAIGVRVVAINANDADAYPEDSFERMVELAPRLPFRAARIPYPAMNAMA
jgi:thiol-disulfide isomerase/thioredoxin